MGRGKRKKREPAEIPAGASRVLLHSCCAPCSGSVIEDIHCSGLDLTVYFYNPNIHPREEYLIRKEENMRFAAKLGIPFIDADYDPDRWYRNTEGREMDPERGERCSICFDMRFAKTAEYASNHGFPVITSCLGISRWKDFEQVTRTGIQAASLFPGVTYWAYNWRMDNGSQRMIQIAKAENFYQQQYCGCAYSLRDTNRHRMSQGRKKIEIGRDYYGSEEPAGYSDSDQSQCGR